MKAAVIRIIAAFPQCKSPVKKQGNSQMQRMRMIPRHVEPMNSSFVEHDTSGYKRKGAHSVEKYNPKNYLRKADTATNINAIKPKQEPTFYDYKLRIKTVNALPVRPRYGKLPSLHDVSCMTECGFQDKSTLAVQESPDGKALNCSVSKDNKSWACPEPHVSIAMKDSLDNLSLGLAVNKSVAKESGGAETKENMELRRKRMQRKWRKLSKRTVFAFEVDLVNNKVDMKRELRPGVEDDVEEHMKAKVKEDAVTLSPHLQKKKAAKKEQRRSSICVYYNPKVPINGGPVTPGSGTNELPALVLKSKLRDNLKVNMKVRKFLAKGTLETCFDLDKLNFSKMEPANYLTLYMSLRNAITPSFYCSGHEELNKVDADIADLVQIRPPGEIQLSPYDASILSTYHTYLSQVEKEEVMSGFWQIHKVYGSKPTCRESAGMVWFGDKFYVFGGYGVDRMNDLWCLSTHADTLWDWSLLRPLGTKIPEKRYGHCMAGWKNHIYVFAGAAEFFPGLKTRVALGDLWKYSIEDNTWQEVDTSATKFERRTHAASCAIEGVWFIHGGTNGANRQILSSTVAFNFETEKFVEFIVSGKARLSDKIGPLAHHTAVAVVPAWLTQRSENGSFWFNYHKWGFSPNDPLTVGYSIEYSLQSERIGIYLLGGMINQYEYNSAVWLIRCNSQKTMALLDSDPMRNMAALNKYIVEVERLRIEGPTPPRRVMQTAVFWDKYIVVFAGKNDRDEGLESHCLHDLCLLDLDTLKWQMIVVYGFTPSGRWGHVMGAQKDALLVFGGVGESRLCSSAVYSLELDRKSIRDNLEECRRVKMVMEAEAKKVGLLGQS